MSENLLLINIGPSIDSLEITYFEEADHSLKTTDETEVNAILERRHGDEDARKHALPLGSKPIVLLRLCHCV